MGIVLDFISGKKNSYILLFLSSLNQSKRDKKTNTPKERKIYWCALVCVLLYLLLTYLLLNVFALYYFILYAFINVMLYI